MRKITQFISISIFLLNVGYSLAQINCGSSYFNEAARKLYPNIAESELKFREMLMNLLAEGSYSRVNGDITYTMPVVFHTVFIKPDW